jgi:hypothetical protein
MVEYAKEILLCNRNRSAHSRIVSAQQVILESIQARSYSDDGDSRREAFIRPRPTSRPGNHDDELRSIYPSIRAAI